MSRPLDKIIDIILSLTPDNFENKHYLKLALESVKESYLYQAPEAQGMSWLRTSQALQTYVGDPDGTTWKREIQGIFANKIDYMDYLGDLK